MRKYRNPVLFRFLPPSFCMGVGVRSSVASGSASAVTYDIIIDPNSVYPHPVFSEVRLIWSDYRTNNGRGAIAVGEGCSTGKLTLKDDNSKTDPNPTPTTRPNTNITLTTTRPQHVDYDDTNLKF